MNYFAHAVPFLNHPYFIAGTAVPDWLAVVDRKVRIRSKHAVLLVDDPDPVIAAVAQGIRQHFLDDACFHEKRVFAELWLELTVLIRDALAGEGSLRPSFLGHLLVEVLLDASLIAEDTARLDAYYRAMESIDTERVQQAVNRMAPQPTPRLAWMIHRFCQERILWDYLNDDRLLVRLNQVMNRVRLGHLPERIRDILPDIRRRVDERKTALLEGIPAEVVDSG
jgi:hypothetical protein